MTRKYLPALSIAFTVSFFALGAAPGSLLVASLSVVGLALTVAQDARLRNYGYDPQHDERIELDARRMIDSWAEEDDQEVSELFYEAGLEEKPSPITAYTAWGMLMAHDAAQRRQQAMLIQEQARRTKLLMAAPLLTSSDYGM